MRPSALARFRRAHLILQSCGSRPSRALMLFQDGRKQVSCFIAVSWASSGSVYGWFSSAAPARGTSVIDPRLPSLRFGGGTVSLGLGVKVTVEVMAIGEAFAATREGVGEAFPKDWKGLGAVVALSDRVRIEATRWSLLPWVDDLDFVVDGDPV